MKNPSRSHTLSKLSDRRRWLLSTMCAAAALSACGGGDGGVAGSGEGAGSGGPQVLASAELASGITSLDLASASLPDTATNQIALPLFHLAPALLDTPDDADAVDPADTARKSPRRFTIPSEFRGMPTSRLEPRLLQGGRHARAWSSLAAQEKAFDGSVSPMASGAVTTYTPAQIRAAYNLPALPAPGVSLTTAQAALLGARQTIYIVDAYNDPNVAAELAAFNAKFGLPGCTTKAVAATATLPLPAASSTACEFSVVYTTTTGAMTGTAPAYNSGWATEIALDAQWAHATAPLARIVLIEVPSSSVTSLAAGVQLANRMGPGVVSMSFGGVEGSWATAYDSIFTGTGMTYLASTGDSGAQLNWPAVSPYVVAVGGTTLTYTGAGSRSEIGWSGTGGGTSRYEPTPSYQTNTVPGLGSVAHRTVADVAFNADPYTGQYTAVMPQGSGTVSWLSAGGTSLSAPQWAGLMAIANAQRAQAAKAPLGAPHAMLYTQIASAPGNYASAFADVVAGSDGACATCKAKIGYDQLTGLGTPNAASLLSALSSTTAAVTPPVVTAATISGKVGTALTFTVSVSAPNPVTYALNGAPTGMSVASTGVVTWASPVAGTYPVTVIARDKTTGLTGQAVYAVSIAAMPAPSVSSASVSGKVGTALSFTVGVSAPNPVTYSLAGAPSGMKISTGGVVTWSSPVAGTYTVTVTATDTKTGLAGKGVCTVNIGTQQPPVVNSATISGTLGQALAFTVSASSPNPATYSLSGAPSGMTIGSNRVVSWPSPVVGTYSVKVIARDTKTGLSGQGVYTVKIAAGAPKITASTMTGVAGRPLTGTLTISDPNPGAVNVSIAGAPLGMTFSVSGMTINVRWTRPVTGAYTLSVALADSSNMSARLNVPVTVTAR